MWTFYTYSAIVVHMNRRTSFIAKVCALATAVVLFSTIFTACLKTGDLAIQNGSQLYQQKKFEESDQFFQQALKEECSYSKDVILIFIANCYSQRGDYDTAISYRKQALEVNEDADNYNNIAMLYRLKKDDATAEAMYRKAIALAPDDAVGYVSLGALCMTADRIDEAIPLLEKAEALNGGIGIGHADLAICYAKKNQFSDAEDEYEEAVKNKADNLQQFRDQLNKIEGKEPESEN